MSNARMAHLFVTCVAKQLWPNDSKGMATMTVDWLASFDNAVDSGSHKYVPAAQLSADLGLEEGSGIFGYRKYPDGSYLLKTCSGIAYWDGGDAKAEWGERA